MSAKLILRGLSVALLLLFVGGGALAQQTPTPVPVEHHVVILVVDDFSTRIHDEILDRFPELAGQQSPEEGTEEPAKGFDFEFDGLPDDALCYFNPLALVEGQAMADGMGGAAFDAAMNPISHGDLVLAQVIEMISRTPSPYSGISISAVPVHVRDYVISDVTAAIQETISDLEHTLGPDNVSFVVNMSFALVPCNAHSQLVNLSLDLLVASAADAWGDFEAALDQLTQQMDSIGTEFRSRSDVGCLFDNIQEQTPLEITEENTEEATPESTEEPSPGAEDACVMQRLLLRDNVVAVASAGNFGLDFPTWPAAWPHVISVSAGTECEGFASADGPERRLFSQRLTYPQDEPLPWCPRGDLMNMRLDVFLTEVVAGTLDPVYTSSRGEVMLPGIWNYAVGMQEVQNLTSTASLAALLDPGDLFYAAYLPDFEGRMTSYDLSTSDYIAGTSFAAPRMSFAMALYMAEAVQNMDLICRNSPSGAVSFAYANGLAIPWNGLDLSLADQTSLQPLMGPNCLDFYTTDVPALLGM